MGENVRITIESSEKKEAASISVESIYLAANMIIENSSHTGRKDLTWREAVEWATIRASTCLDYWDGTITEALDG